MAENHEQFDLPTSLKGDLRRAYAAGPVPAEMDALILRPRRRVWPRGVGGLIAAAVAAVALIGGGVYFGTLHRPVAVAYQRTGDIRDAYLLARALDEKRPVDARWDQNADGRVDRDDVRQLAQLAVKLPAEVR